MSKGQIILIRAHLPLEFTNRYLQHIRNFDVANPGCHFEIMLEDSGLSMQEMVKLVTVDPALTFTEILKRK